MPDAVAIRAHAKLNLALAVGPPEPPTSAKPGYHPIVSWFSAIDLADELLLRALAREAPSRFSIRFAPDAPGPGAGGPATWPLEQDLAFRAHALLAKEVSRTLPVELTLTKRIPAGGGLGGGSSDAAATLLALRQLFDLDVPFARLSELGATLGSDVPFFIDEGVKFGLPPRPAVVTGFGETVDRLAHRDCAVVLVIPPFGVSTRAVYRAFDLRAHLFDAQGVRVRTLAAGNHPLWSIEAGLRNGLAATACDSVEPRLSQIVAQVRRDVGIDLHLSGSGSTLFHLCDPDLAIGTAGRLCAAVESFEGVFVLPTHLV